MLGKFKVRSNREAGLGRFDITLIPKDYFKKMYRPIIIEFKVAKEKRELKEYSGDDLMRLAETALEQIETRKYYAEYLDEYGKEDFLLIGIGCHEKLCKVVSNEK